MSTSNDFAYYLRDIVELEQTYETKYKQKFRIEETMMTLGTYTLIVLYHAPQMAIKREVYLSFNNIKVVSGQCENPGDFRCPQNLGFCASSFIECSMLSEKCQDPSKPFYCKNAASDDLCVSNIDQCCKTGSAETNIRWCPSRGKCQDLSEDKCCDHLPETPVYCKSEHAMTGYHKCYTNQFDCCSDLTFEGKPMV